MSDKRIVNPKEIHAKTITQGNAETGLYRKRTRPRPVVACCQSTILLQASRRSIAYSARAFCHAHPVLAKEAGHAQIAKAVELAAGIVVTLGGGAYGVYDRDQQRFYIVDCGARTCECAEFYFTHLYCAHVFAVRFGLKAMQLEAPDDPCCGNGRPMGIRRIKAEAVFNYQRHSAAPTTQIRLKGRWLSAIFKPHTYVDVTLHRDTLVICAASDSRKDG